MKKYIPLLYCIIFCFLAQTRAQTIHTIAGIDSAGYNGDGMAATLSALNRPFSVAVNNSGNVYIADRGNSRVRMINSTGTITTIAGTGLVGAIGDGGPATRAMISNITGVAADGAGNIYIADKGNERIRKINASGLITTIAGDGTPGNSGDGGAATAAELNNPNGVAVDIVGNVYIADQGNNRIRKVSASGIITTIAGIGTNGYNGDGIAATAAQLYNPYAVAVDLSGNVYIADVDNNRIRKVSVGGIISTIAGTGTGGNYGEGGPATAAELSEPIGVAVDSAENVYVADAWNSRICVINTNGILNTVVGNETAGFSGDAGPAKFAELNEPYGVAVDRSGIYIADYSNDRIRFVNYSTTKINTVAAAPLPGIYPNPSTGRFTITLSAGVAQPSQIVITNVLGQVVLDMKSGNKTEQIDLGTQAGLYSVSIITANGKWVEPLVIEDRK